MNCKKTIAGISALSLLLSTSAISAVTASAADDEKNYKEEAITAHLYNENDTTTMKCRYYNDKPNIPYIRLSEFYKTWLDQDLEITNNNDGTYEVKVPIGTTGTIDTNKDTLYSDDLGYFIVDEESASGESFTNDLFLKAETDEHEAVEETMDFAAYNIDLIGDDNDIWWPAPTLCDTFASGTKEKVFLDDQMYFCNMLMTDYDRISVTQSLEHITNMVEKYKDGRPKDLVEYNYNELCLLMDSSYGYPGRMAYNELMQEKGFDGLLEEANADTKKIKELLLSEDFDEYCVGFDMLNDYFFDGGHTSFVDLQIAVDKPIPENPDFQPIFNGEIAKKREEMKESYGKLENSIDIDADEDSTTASYLGVSIARNEMLKTADKVEQMKFGIYSEKGDTAVFSFDTFVMDPYGWDAYYHNGADIPDDIVAELYQTIAMADANPAIKKYVFDVGTNGGGHIYTAMYIMGLVNDTTNMVTRMGDELIDNEYIVDKNLDKVIDEKDDNFTTDLEYAVISSKVSFSCGNLLPSLAKENNILRIGERSGGGSCAVGVCITPDGSIFSVSTGLTLVDSKGESIDLGIEPDYKKFTLGEDGSKDFSETYNYDNISKLFDEYYKNETSTTTSVTTTSTETTTTTSAVSTTSASTSESATSSTAAESTTTTVSTTESTSTTTVTTAESKKFGTPEEIGKMVARDYFVKTGKNATVSDATIANDGTYSYELKDEAGNVVDKYTIDPATGKGTDSKGNEVSLPQTGMNSLGTVATAAGAAMLMLTGAIAAYGSGVLRKKKEND